MRIQSRGYSTNVWISSETGVIDSTIILSAPTLEKILQAVNEKYGTSFEGWSQLPTAYEVGDTVPNWSAYEKIELQNIKVKFNDGSFGEIRESKFYIATSNGTNLIIAIKESGVVATLTGTAVTDQMKTNYVNGLRYYGYNVDETIAETESLSVGDEIEGWDEYVLVY